MTHTPEMVIDTLRARGDLWVTLPGLLGYRGELLRLVRALDARLHALALSFTGEEWRLPPAIGFDALARADYFASFPQWLTAAGHLPGDDLLLERIAGSADPANAARNAVARMDAALPPAVCYHVYERLASRTITEPLLVTAQETCWRHEGERHAPLARGWAFTMREVVCLGTPAEVEHFRQAGIARTRQLAVSLGLDTELQLATDPFFAPTARGKAMLQRLKALKHELTVPLDALRNLAIASFNNHEGFFGDAFDIRLADGSPAASACIAFGLERWTLAYLMAHGTETRDWPATAESRSSRLSPHAFRLAAGQGTA